jgi:hypothetical protein
VANAALTFGALCFGLALLALTRIEETFHRDLDYEERPEGLPEGHSEAVKAQGM